jgi:hypothetical protein
MAVSPAPRREAAPSSGASHRSDGTVLDTRRPPHRTSGIPYGAGEGSRRNPTPGPQPSIA